MIEKYFILILLKQFSNNSQTILIHFSCKVYSINRTGALFMSKMAFFAIILAVVAAVASVIILWSNIYSK